MTKPTPAPVIQDAVDLVEAGHYLQAQGLALLIAEMHGLAALLPGITPAPVADAKTAAETEAGFDNMPV